MAWFGTALARHGYVVVAVDHPGNNGRDPMTVGGAVLFWERPGDLAIALDRVKSDSSLGPISISTGSAPRVSRPAASRASSKPARVWISTASCNSVTRIRKTAICAPQKEFQFPRSDAEAFFAQPAGAAALAHAKDDLSIPGVKPPS